MRPISKTGLLLASVPLFISTAALAQDAEPAATAAGDAGEIVVTATKRTQNIIDVPISISNYTADQLAKSGINDVRELMSIAPSLNVSSTVGDSFGAVVRIRGVGTSGSNAGLESATGLYVDGVYRNRAGVALSDIQGIDRIEVLRGPQGTLFGRNTTAGVVSIQTARPSFDFHAELEGTVGNLDAREIRGSVTGPVSSTVALRLDGSYFKRDGTLKDFFNGQDYFDRNRYQLRGQILFRPSDDIDVRIIVDHADRDEAGGNADTYRVVSPAVLALTNAFGYSLVTQFKAKRFGANQTLADFFEKVRETGISGEINWDTGIGKVTSITSYRDWRSKRTYDTDGNPIDILRDINDGETFKTFTQELRLQGKTGRLDYLIGAFFIKEHLHSRDNFSFGNDFEEYLSALSGVSLADISAITGQPIGSILPFGSGARDVHFQKTRNISLFTHNTFSVLDNLSVTGGLRYSSEHKSLLDTLATPNPACAGAVALHGPDLVGVPAGIRGLICAPNWDTRSSGIYRTSFNESEWSGVVSVEYKPTIDTNLYASYSRGHKAGGFTLDRSGLPYPHLDPAGLHFKPEFADAFEVGFKGVTSDRKLRGSVALFHTKFSDYQFTYSRTLPDGTSQRLTTNLPKLVSQGFEIEATAAPARWLTATTGITYASVKYGKSGFPVGLTQLQGTRAPFAPKWVVSGSVRVGDDIGSNLKWFIYGDGRWQSETNASLTAAVSPQFHQEAYAIFDGRIGLATQNDRVAVELWGRNLFDKAVYSVVTAASLQPGTLIGYLNDPRTFGVTIRTKW